VSEKRDAAAAAALRHPVRAALVDLIRRNGTVTSADAARELGGSTGLYSFHLRQLARYGLIDEAPAGRGRVRPWRLAGAPDAPDAGPVAGDGPDLGGLARGLEDEAYQRWLARRSAAPARWQHDEAFSQVLYLTPRELAGMGAVIRELVAGYRQRETRPATRPPGAAPVAVVARLFPLLEP
jgi:Helix-turn-helix domain